MTIVKSQQQRIFDLIANWVRSNNFRRILPKGKLVLELGLLRQEGAMVTKVLTNVLGYDTRKQQLFEGVRAYVYNLPGRQEMAEKFQSLPNQNSINISSLIITWVNSDEFIFDISRQRFAKEIGLTEEDILEITVVLTTALGEKILGQQLPDGEVTPTYRFPPRSEILAALS